MWHIRTALKEYKPSNTTFTATCFGFCGKPSSGNVKNTHRNIIYKLPIGLTLFYTPQISSIQKMGAVSADTKLTDELYPTKCVKLQCDKEILQYLNKQRQEQFRI